MAKASSAFNLNIKAAMHRHREIERERDVYKECKLDSATMAQASGFVRFASGLRVQQHEPSSSPGCSLAA